MASFDDADNSRRICYFELTATATRDQANTKCAEKCADAQLAIIPSLAADNFISTAFADFLSTT